MYEQQAVDCAVVGGGLAGLAAAALLARAGKSVLVYEAAGRIGGRARTRRRDGFALNLGPHALYRGGAAEQVLAELGIVPRGRPPLARGYAVYRGVAHRFPGGPLSLLTTGLFGMGARLETARLFAGLPHLARGDLASRSVEEWLDAAVRHETARAFLRANLRVSTYAADSARQSAGAALDQLRRALRPGVLYLDDGWQPLVDGLERAARAAGARIVPGARVAGVRGHAGRWLVTTAAGVEQAAQAVILAIGPGEAAALLEDGAAAAVRAWADRARPVLAACLDVGLRSLPRPGVRLAFGIDRPLYLSVHSAVARLASPGQTLIHLATYLDEDGGDPPAMLRELEALLDLAQPGWRERVLYRRFLPRLVVANALVTAADGGLAGRPGPTVPGAPGLFVAGDWVGPTGMLADAALASAASAAALALAVPAAGTGARAGGTLVGLSI